MLGFIGDFGNGLLYFIARSMDWGQGAIFRATADYGTKFIVCGGLLNFIAAIDAYTLHREETMNFNFSHFTAALIFSICASVVFGITQRDEPRRMIRYGFYCFAWFIAESSSPAGSCGSSNASVHRLHKLRRLQGYTGHKQRPEFLAPAVAFFCCVILSEAKDPARLKSPARHQGHLSELSI